MKKRLKKSCASAGPRVSLDIAFSKLKTMENFEITFMTTPLQEMDLEGAQTSINGLSYERIPGRGVRFRFGDMNVSPVGHMWFLRGMDLRRMTLRVFYAGAVPLTMNFYISRSSLAERHLFPVQLEKTDETRVFDLAVPDRPEFKETSIFGFYFERRGASSKAGDFTIEKIQMIEMPQPAAAAGSRRGARG